MINADMRDYDYYLYEDENAYGQAQLSETAKGTIKMAVNVSSERGGEHVGVEGAEFTGLAYDANISSKYVIQYGNDKLKVLYVNPKGRFKQVFMARM